jgi:hypothetical protein
MIRGFIATRQAQNAGNQFCGLGIVALLLLPMTLSAQVEDLGSQAQGIVDQMRAQANNWTPQMQQQSVMGSSSGSGVSVQNGVSNSYTPSLSPAMQRQIQQQEQRIQLMQQRQQLMMAGAQMAGQIAGQLLAQALFNPGADQQAQQAALQQQQELAALHQAQVTHAAQMRSEWDQRDAGMSDDLASVFSSPGPKSTAFFGVGGGPDSSSILSEPAPSTSTDFFDSAGSVAVSDPAPTPDSSVVVIDSPSAAPALAPEFLAAQQVRAVQTSAFNDGLSSWGRVSVSAPPVPAADWRGMVADQFTSYGISFAINEVKGSAAYANMMNSLQYVPGYEWAGKAKSAFDYVSNLRGEFYALYNPLQTEVTRTTDLAMNGAMNTAAFIASPNLEGSAYVEDYNNQVLDQRDAWQTTGSLMIKGRLSAELGSRNNTDAEIMKVQDAPSRVVPVNVETTPDMRQGIFQETGGHVF